MFFATTRPHKPTPPKPLERGGNTPLYLQLIIMIAVIGPLIALSQIIAYWRTDVVDDQMFAYYGWRIANGATVYLDVWDNKPPGVYWINALAMLVSGGSYFGVLTVCGLALAIAHYAFYMAASAVYQRGAAVITTILLSFYLTHAFYTGGTNRTETFLVAAELGAVAIYLRAWQRDHWWKWYLAGVLCGVAFLFKQVGLAAWGCMGLHLIILVIARKLTWQIGAQRGLLLLCGASTTVALAGIYLAAQGALFAALYATFGFNREYFNVGDSQFPYNYATYAILQYHFFPILKLPLLMVAAATLHAFLWWSRPRYRPAEIEKPLQRGPAAPPYFFLFLLFWFLVALYGAMLSPHGFRHYIIPTIPPLIMLAGYLINVLRAEASLLVRAQQRAWVAMALVIMGYFAADAVVRQFGEMSKIWVFRIDPWLTGVGEYDEAHWEVVGQAVLKHTTPDQTIQCWGYMPGVYLYARRENACRFTTTEKVGQVRGGALFVLYELQEKLRDDPPALITMQSGDYVGLHHADNAKLTLPPDITLGTWLDENYTLIEEIPRFGTVYIFKRNDLVPPGHGLPLPSVDAQTTRPAAKPPNAPGTHA